MQITATKLTWFSDILQHSTRKQDGLIPHSTMLPSWHGRASRDSQC